jgi:hypothetical protein
VGPEFPTALDRETDDHMWPLVERFLRPARAGEPAWRRLPRWVLPAAAVAALAGGAVLYACDPRTTWFYPFCPLHRLTGLNCPGCGALRAAHSLLHGQVGAAFRLNPLLLLSPLFLAALALRPAWCRRAWVAWAACGVLVAYGVLRNIPAWPFTLFAPG